MAPASLYQSTAAWSTTSAYTNQVWQAWYDSTSYTTSATTVWQEWTASATPLYYLDPPQVNVRAPTEQELAIARGRQENYARDQAVMQAARKVAHDKSVELLESLLDREQLASFRRAGFFDVRVGQRSYRLGEGQPKLLQSEDGKRFSFCIHPREVFPKGDELAALKLMIEADERMFLRTANASRLADAA